MHTRNIETETGARWIVLALALFALVGMAEARSAQGENDSPEQILRAAYVTADLGDPDEAARQLVRAAGLLEDLAAPTREDFATWLEVAESLKAMGVLDIARETIDTGLGRLEAILGAKDPARLGWIHQAADVRAWTRNYLAVIACVDEHLGDFPETDERRFNLINAKAIALDMREQGEAARALLAEAIVQCDATCAPDNPKRALLRDTYGVVLSKLGRLEEASALRDELGALEGLEPNVAASNLENHAYLLMKMGSFDVARQKFIEALEIWHATYDAGHIEVVRLLGLMSVFEIRMGQYAAAARWNELSRRSFEISRLKIRDRFLRATLFEGSPHGEAAFLKLQENRTDEAWIAVDGIGGRTTLELCSEAPNQRECAELSRRLRKLQGLAFDRLLAEVNQTELGENADLLRAQEDLEKLETDLDERFPWRLGARNVEMVQERLEPGQAIVGWLVHASRDLPPNKQYAWILRRDEGVRFLRIGAVGGVWNDIASAMGALRRGVASVFGANEIPELKSIAADLVHPLLPYLEGIDELVVCPSDLFLKLPLEVLPDLEGKPLLERFDISYTPSAGVWSFLEDRPLSAHPERALLVGDPPFSPKHLIAMKREAEGKTERPRSDLVAFARAPSTVGLDELPRLPATRDEVLAIAELYDEATVLLGADAAEARIDALRESGSLAEFGTVHFASHARIDYAKTHDSLIALARQPEVSGDGCITVAEILDGWKLSADLVTLSACTTIDGQRAAREGLLGFTQALFAAGARSVLVSQWPVDDAATRMLMQRFYENWRGDAATTKTAALAEAKRWLRAFETPAGDRPYAHPSVWAAFVLVGASD